jgi:hypothetical protein
MCDSETVSMASVPAAECVTVRDGKIVYSWFIFDRTSPVAAAAATGLSSLVGFEAGA